jgi:hypothetical protein
LLNEALHIPHLFQAYGRIQVSAEQLALFETNAQEYGPKLRNTWIDKRAIDTKSMLALQWNRALIAKLAREAEDIVNDCITEPRGNISWTDFFRDRLYNIVLDVCRARPQGDEKTAADVVRRMGVEWQKRKTRNKYTGVLHHVSGIFKANLVTSLLTSGPMTRNLRLV